MAVFILVHSIKALQLHGSDEVTSNPLLGLIFSTYSLLRPLYPSLLNILKQVPNASDETLITFDNRVMTMIANQEKILDKSKRDLMRKILKPVIAVIFFNKYFFTNFFLNCY